jgi:hypothetical protein
MTCNKNSHLCPEYLRAHSERIKAQWDSDAGKARKEATDFRDIAIRGIVTKQKLDLFNKPTITDPATAKTYRSYARVARTRAQQWAKDQGYELGQQTYHVDHKFSLMECFKNNLPIDVANHPYNLQVISATDNSSKGMGCSITLEELLKNSFTIYVENT